MRCSVVESVTATSLGGGVSREEFRGLNSDGLGDRDAGEMMRLLLRKWDVCCYEVVWVGGAGAGGSGTLQD